jgi:hypothetical protein
MRRDLGPHWSDEQRAAGERLRQSWEGFFTAGRDQRGEGAPPGREPSLPRVEDLSFTAVRARHEATLLRYPNVVAVAEGVRSRRGRPTGERCLVVYVSRKVPRAELRPNDVLPAEIEGVPVDVVEAGPVEALPADPLPLPRRSARRRPPTEPPVSGRPRRSGRRGRPGRGAR